MTEISKINKLKNVEGFIQVDYFKADKYIDKAGEFLDSLYETREQSPKYQMTPAGAHIALPPNKELKVSAGQLWTHISDPDSQELQLHFMLNAFEKAVELFGPKEYDRVGWRNYFVYDTDIDSLKFAAKENWFGGRFLKQTIEKEIDGFKVTISILRVKNNETRKEGVLFDIDVYQQLESTNDPSKVVKTLRGFEKIFNSPLILEVVNAVLK